MSPRRRRSRSVFLDPMFYLLAGLLLFLSGGMIYRITNEPVTIAVELDAAYGGDATGYVGIIAESEFNEALIDKLEELMQDDIRFTLYRSHAASASASTEDKAIKITADDPDIVLSIHCAYAPDENVSGMNVYANLPRQKGHEESLRIADAITASFSGMVENINELYLYYEPFGDYAYTLKTVDVEDETDYDYETWLLMESTDVPVVIVEQIYCTSQSDLDAWNTEEGIEKIASTYYEILKEAYGLSDE